VRGRELGALRRRHNIIRAESDQFAVLKSAVPSSLPRDVRDDVIGALAVAMIEHG
jgi:hypothetical protein